MIFLEFKHWIFTKNVLGTYEVKTLSLYSDKYEYVFKIL